MLYSHENLFGGSGTVTVRNLLAAPVPRPFTTVLSCELSPAGSVGPHSQEHDPELVIVTHGFGSAVVNGQVYPLAEGVVVAVPLGATLSLENTSPETPLRYLIVKASSPGVNP